MLCRLVRGERGNVTVLAALAVPALIVALGSAVDYAKLVQTRTGMQAAADAAALAGATAFAVSGTSDKTVIAAASAIAEAELGEGPEGTELAATVDRKARRVTVTARRKVNLFVGELLGGEAADIEVSATAGLFGNQNICVLALGQKVLSGVHLNLLSRIEARGCGIYSNARTITGIRIDALSRIKASLICSAGGVLGLLSNMQPYPVTDCPVMEDPLAERKEPETARGCDHLDVKINRGTETLKPGTYCGGITISGTASVTFSAGLYVIKDGPFLIKGKAEAIGRDTGFFLTGQQAAINFRDDARVRLSGPESGPLAGLLIFETRSAPANRLHIIRSRHIEQLTGTIYLPKTTLLIDPNATVAGESAYTAIIANALSMTEGPTLILKADYDATPVPVPDGIRAATQVVLTK